jgi:hypothetical protein
MFRPRLVALLAALGCLLPAGVLGAPPAGFLRLSPTELEKREQNAGQDPVRLLLLVPLANEASAKRLRQRVAEILLAHGRNATAAELTALTARLAEVLPAAAPSPAAAREVLGPPQQVARQILYRRYLEAWSYDSPVSLCLVFDCRTGQEPRLQAVHPLRAEKM